VRLTTAPALVVAAYRMAFSTALLLPAVARRGRGRQRDGDRWDLLLCLLAGVFLAVHFGTWISALSYTSVASATVLVNTQPVFVAVFAWVFLGERLGGGEILSVLGAVVGSAILAGAGTSVTAARGDLLALAGAVSMAGYMIVGRAVRPRFTVVAYTSIVYGTASVILIAASLAFGLPFFGHPVSDYLLFLAMAVFCTLLGHSLMNWALRYLPATFIGTALLGEPVLATVMALVVFAEVPGLGTLLGGALILASIYAFTRFSRRRG
jgi:drug/metabolite transporter (DMT)-like permease